MLDHLLDALACPHCGRSFEAAGGGLVCRDGHRFDIARQGYVNLLRGPAPAAADTAAMVAARARVQSAGLHAAVTDELAAAVDRSPASGLVADLGAGTGHHLAAILARVRPPAGPEPVGLALDLSRYAARRAARAHPRIGAVVCDVWGALPVRSGVADVVLDVFAPRHAPEIARVLTPDGVLVVVTPAPNHLAPLVERLALLRVGADKLERLDADMATVGELTHRATVEGVVTLDHDMLDAMVAMGPSSHHLEESERRARVARLPGTVDVTIAATVSTYRRGR